MTNRDDDLQASALQARKFSLDHAVDLAANGLRNGRSYKHTDIVEAAEAFERFLLGAHGQAEPADLNELLDAPQWFDPEWRLQYLQAVTAAVVQAVDLERFAGAIGNFTRHSADERFVIKGVRGLQAHYLALKAQNDAGRISGIDAALMEESSFEPPISLTVEHRYDINEEELLGSLQLKTAEFIPFMAACLTARAHEAIAAVTHAAGWDPDYSDEFEAYWPPAPFRVEVVQRDGWKAKEWTEDGGLTWHFWMRIRIGVAAFVIPADV